MIAGHGFYYSSVRFLFFSMDFLFGVLLCMYVAWCYVGQHAAREGTSDQHL
jgi:Ni,Fe-hydrogenase I cytochrome b subunit